MYLVKMSANALRILFITYQGGMAGSTHSIVYLAKGLADKGHAIYVGIRKEMPIWELTEYPGITRVPMQIRGKFDFQNWAEIRDIVRKEGIQIINAQSSHDRFTSIFAKLRFSLPVHIVHTRRQNPLSSLGWFHTFINSNFTSGIVVISEGLKQIFIEKGYPEDHLKVIHNGIPSQRLKKWNQERVDQFRASLDIQENDKIVGCISRLKEQEQLIAAVAKMNDSNIRLVFAGVSNEQMHPILQKYFQHNAI